MEAADCLFLHLIKDKIYESIIPSKLQAYIEIGKPILAGIEGEARELVVNNDLGVAFESENEDDFVKATLEISTFNEIRSNEIKLRSLNLYKKEFSRKAGVEKIYSFIRKNL
jgi:glycosyltransferase involved in cell wall biosynthesis